MQTQTNSHILNFKGFPGIHYTYILIPSVRCTHFSSVLRRTCGDCPVLYMYVLHTHTHNTHVRYKHEHNLLAVLKRNFFLAKLIVIQKHVVNLCLNKCIKKWVLVSKTELKLPAINPLLFVIEMCSAQCQVIELCARTKWNKSVD